MSFFYRNLIVGFFWVVLFYVIVVSQASQMLLTMFFTVFLLFFSERLISDRLPSHMKKNISLIISLLLLVLLSWGLYASLNLMISDFNNLINSSQEKIVSLFNEFGMKVSTIKEIESHLFEFIKNNSGFLVITGSMIVKVTIGVILGIILFFSPIVEFKNNAWGSILKTVVDQSRAAFNSFKNIMEIQILISMMNTFIISLFSLVFTKIIFGVFLPYWYVIIIFTAILSMVPVVGNVMINFILLFATIQLDPYYSLVGIGLFLIIHKLELLVIGKKIDEKVHIPFIVILFSMVIGEMVFESLSGMILGMVLILTFATLLMKTKIKESSHYLSPMDTRMNKKRIKL